MSRRSRIGKKKEMRKAKRRAHGARLTVEQLEARFLPNSDPSVFSPIKHVIYVIKENRTFDQEFGSLGKGNGDPSLNLFGDESAPNSRALQRQFVTLDNFYADADVSADGWNWATGALANTYVQKAFPPDYSPGDRGRPYDFEGGNLATSPGPDPNNAFIWDKLTNAGISYRNYGFRVFHGHVASTEPNLLPNTDLNFQGFDLSKPDSFATLFGPAQPTRIDEWLKEFNQYVADSNLPTVEFVRLPNDHNAGTFKGAPTPRAYTLDNDIALGKLVDAVSHSKYWGSTAIFVTEDDAQDGPDHVDAHRTISQVISPYTQTGNVDSTFYSTVSMLHTMEQIIGIPPMTQFDAAAHSMANAFTSDANMTPYTAITPDNTPALLNVLNQKNPSPNPLAQALTAADFEAAGLGTEDQLPTQQLNQQIWQSVKGDEAMPASRHTVQLQAGPRGDGTGVTPQGRILTPAGRQVDLGNRPFGIAISPDGNTILVSNDGSNNIESLMVIDRASGNVVQTIEYTNNDALYVGLAFSPDGKHAYASAGGNNKIRVYDVNGQQLTETRSIPVPPANAKDNPFPAGLAVSADGKTLYVADDLDDHVSVIDLAGGTVTASIAVGHNPYTVVLSADGKTAYVSNWGGTTVSAVDVSTATPNVIATIGVGTHPCAMLLNPQTSELYVANADSDNVSVIDTGTNLLTRTINLLPFPGAHYGSSPNALALSPDNKTLYVANAMDDDVAVVRLAQGGQSDQVEGLIPTAWLPSGIVVSPDGNKLYVINAKGLGAGPNIQGPNPYLDPESTDSQYVPSMIIGTMSIIDVPGTGKLKAYTRQVFENNQFPLPDGGVLQNIDHFVVIYQENWSFDSLYGFFPGANGIANATDANGDLLPQFQQVDKNGNVITTVPQPLGPDGNPDPRFPASLPANPYNLVPFIRNSTPNIPAGLMGDLIHRFYHEQLQIDNGALQPSTTSNNNKFVTWSDNPGLVLGYINATNLPEGQLAQQYSLDDDFFHAAYGGSFLNHQFLIAADAPQWLQPIPAGFQSSFDPATQTLKDANLTIDGKFDVNTTRPLQAPHFATDNPAKLLAPINDNHPFNADGSPDPTYMPTIGDRLDNAGITWRWYSGGWTNALEGHADTAPFGGGFQFHHQPFDYYANFAPFNPDGSQNPQTSSLLNPNAHLQDETQFFADLAGGNLPAVSFIKAIGANNEHPGYANLLRGQQHVADIVHAIQNSPEWAHTAIIITYDENGGLWDHVSPPQANGPWGDGSRVPAIVISPYAKQGFVDHTEHDTLSILKSLELRFGLAPLSQFDANATSLASNFQATAHASIGSAYAQVDADNPGKFALIVQGTEGKDKISITQDSGEIHVQINDSFDRFFAVPITRIEIYGQGGNDKITVAPDIRTPTFIFAGSGNNKITSGGGATVVVGGKGKNDLIGGGGPSILIGGSGHEKIETGSGPALAIAGTTNFDANAEALRALLTEWTRIDETFAEKVAHLTGGASGGQNVLPGTSINIILDSSTVQSHGGKDVIVRHDDTGVRDVIFAHLFGKRKDSVDDIDADTLINLKWPL